MYSRSRCSTAAVVKPRRCSTEYIACWEGVPHLGDSSEAVGGARERDGERESERATHTELRAWVIPMRQ